VVSSVEHSAVLHAVDARGASGFRVVRVPVDGSGRVDPGAFAAALDRGTALAALQWANPETGVLQPLPQVAEACARAGVPLLVDAVQGLGKLAVGPEGIPGDLVAVSAHKIGGPQGVGALRVRGNALSTALVPGVQERRRRGGTEAVALLAAFGAAAALPPAPSALRELRDALEARLAALPLEATIFGREAERLPNTTLFSVPGVRGETLAIAADLAGFSVSTGSACASGAVEPSHVLRAMRVSLGWTTTAREVEAFARALPEWVARARSSPAG
jgi:cysteine desulfurase